MEFIIFLQNKFDYEYLRFMGKCRSFMVVIVIVVVIVVKVVIKECADYVKSIKAVGIAINSFIEYKT